MGWCRTSGRSNSLPGLISDLSEDGEHAAAKAVLSPLKSLKGLQHDVSVAVNHPHRGQENRNVVMLELDDIQHLLLTRAPALTARYEFLSFRDGAGGRAWAAAIKETIHSAASMRAGVDKDKRWVTAAFTWNGLRALGLDKASLASFPEGLSRACRRGRRCSVTPE